MIELARGWPLTVERGPDWLFVQLERPSSDADHEPPLAGRIWELLRQHFVNRLVLELDEVDRLESHLVGQLVLLHKRIHTDGGMMRVCGLSPSNQQVLKLSRLADRFPNFADRDTAMAGFRPMQPR